MEFEIVFNKIRNIGGIAYRESWNRDEYIHLVIPDRPLTVVNVRLMEMKKPTKLLDFEFIPNQNVKTESHMVLPYFDKITTGFIERGWNPTTQDMMAKDWETS
jgi:hypothetical protein